MEARSTVAFCVTAAEPATAVWFGHEHHHPCWSARTKSPKPACAPATMRRWPTASARPRRIVRAHVQQHHLRGLWRCQPELLAVLADWRRRLGHRAGVGLCHRGPEPAPGGPQAKQLYGYWPMASSAVLQPLGLTEAGFSDGAAHRANLHAVYNQVLRCNQRSVLHARHGSRPGPAAAASSSPRG